ncbi:MAG: pyruvate formate-lyase, partial [Christensenellaceae bacterium]|nr:pyruvate formate-lyase [Christensenellaceae bacterium]
RRARHGVHETGDLNNITPDYMLMIGTGFDGAREQIAQSRKRFLGDKQKQRFLSALEEMIALLQDLAERYRQKALEVGNETVANTFAKIPARPAETLLEAMQFFRLLHYGLWCANNYQVTVGRADQYLYPYYLKDMATGQYTRDDMLELVEEFFLSFNRDSDLYEGVQQGDNGQSLVLGGVNEDGSDSYNELSELMLTASLELKVIDPKINLRVSAKTPFDRIVEATKLTRQGLGFPQYMNDDINIPALINWGYKPEDAFGYSVAACWELIIPGKGTDIPNADGLSFAKVVLNAAKKQLMDCETYEDFVAAVRKELKDEVDRLIGSTKNLCMIPAPMLSLMMTGCIENARDAADGCEYNNIGFHGPGLSTAADSMAAIRRFVFEEKSVPPGELLTALENDYAGSEALMNTLRCDAPKMGHDDDETDAISVMLLDTFAEALKGRKNERGGIYRAGTAAAMYYIWSGEQLGATPDGRRAREPLPCNYSPSLFAKVKGPISTIKSFTKQNLKDVANGGPLTLELHDTVFRAPDSLEKVASLVRLFIERGGHQLQLNAVNREAMLDAQKRPELYRNMIVRVWGWSGYFVELDKEYQDQIIQRAEFVV